VDHHGRDLGSTQPGSRLTGGDITANIGRMVERDAPQGPASSWPGAPDPVAS
jgi:hypothetical protein